MFLLFKINGKTNSYFYNLEIYFRPKMADSEEYNGDNLIYEAEVSDTGVDGDDMEVKLRCYFFCEDHGPPSKKGIIKFSNIYHGR